MNQLAEGPYWIDTHCHLNFDAFEADRETVFERAINANVRHIVIPATGLETAIEAKEMAAQCAAISFSVGVHPSTNVEVTPDLLAQFTALAAEPGCVAVGEIGLDYYWDYCPKERQRANLEAQLELAETLNLPVILHCRDAFDDLWPIVRAWGLRLPENRGVFHAFDGDSAQAAEITEAGFFVGIGGAITHKNKPIRRETARTISLDRIVLETDAPYLTPVPYRGERNEPGYIPLIAEFLAELRGIPVEDVHAAAYANSLDLFGLH